MSKLQVVKELHRDARKNFTRRRSVMRGIADTLQADLIELPTNRQMKYCLTVIDTFSKMAYVRPLKSKSGLEVVRAMKSVLESIERPVKNLQVDMGKEFYNKDMTHLLQINHINRYSTFSSKKAAIVERFNRTLKKKLYEQFSFRGNYKWLDIIQKLVDEYNNTKHSTIKMAPNEVNSENEQHLLNTVYNYKRNIKPDNNVKFKIGDRVRLSKYKHIFQKGYLPSWTTEIFTIKKIQYTNPITYLLVDLEGDEIKGGVYAEEMQLVKNPDVYLVEKIVRRKNDKLYVKWLGFSNKYNSWINKNDMF